jgi:hypothetical protein
MIIIIKLIITIISPPDKNLHHYFPAHYYPGRELTIFIFPNRQFSFPLVCIGVIIIVLLILCADYTLQVCTGSGRETISFPCLTLYLHGGKAVFTKSCTVSRKEIGDNSAVLFC